MQSRERRDRSVDGVTRSVNLNLYSALAPAWTGRIGAFFQDSDEARPGADRVIRQLTLGAERRVAVLGLSGIVGPGLVARAVRGGLAGSDELGPTLAPALERRRHALRLDYALPRQDRRAGDDALDQRLGLRCTYTLREHQLGVGLDYLGRDPDAAETAHGSRIGLYYTYQFDRPPRVAGQGVVTGGLAVYEARLLEGVDQRQRLVLVDEGGRLTGAVLVIEFDEVDAGEAAARNFERVRALLIERYGRPETSYERGTLDPDLARAVNTERAVRVDEWPTPDGRLRFGLPRRLDGKVRMELHHARDFPGPRDSLWSLDAVP